MTSSRILKPKGSRSNLVAKGHPQLSPVDPSPSIDGQADSEEEVLASPRGLGIDGFGEGSEESGFAQDSMLLVDPADRGGLAFLSNRSGGNRPHSAPRNSDRPFNQASKGNGSSKSPPSQHERGRHAEKGSPDLETSSTSSRKSTAPHTPPLGIPRSVYSRIQAFHHSTHTSSEPSNLHYGHGRSPGQEDGASSSASSSTDSLWGTPADARAIAMGLVVPPTPAQNPRSPLGNSDQWSEDATFESGAASSPEALSSSIHSQSAQSDSQLSSAETTVVDSAWSFKGGASKGAAAAASSARPEAQITRETLHAMRGAVTSDLRLLLWKSLQRQCDRCETGLGLWLWTWTHELLCASCLADEVSTVPFEMKASMLEVRDGADIPSTAECDDADTDMLARIANALPKEALLSLVLAGQSTALGKETGPRGANAQSSEKHSMGARRDGLDSFMELSLSKPKTTGFRLREALGRLSKRKSMSGVHISTQTKFPSFPTKSRDTSSSASSSPRSAKIPLPLTATMPESTAAHAEAPRASHFAGVRKKSKSLLRARSSRLSSPRSPGASSSDLSLGSPPFTPRSQKALLHPSSQAPPTATPLDAAFRALSTVYVGMLSIQQIDGELAADSKLHAYADDVWVCRSCPGSAEDPNGTAVLASEKAAHVVQHHHIRDASASVPTWRLLRPGGNGEDDPVEEDSSRASAGAAVRPSKSFSRLADAFGRGPSYGPSPAAAGEDEDEDDPPGFFDDAVIGTEGGGTAPAVGTPTLSDGRHVLPRIAMADFGRQGSYHKRSHSEPEPGPPPPPSQPSTQAQAGPGLWSGAPGAHTGYDDGDDDIEELLATAPNPERDSFATAADKSLEALRLGLQSPHRGGGGAQHEDDEVEEVLCDTVFSEGKLQDGGGGRFSTLRAYEGILGGYGEDEGGQGEVEVWADDEAMTAYAS